MPAYSPCKNATCGHSTRVQLQTGEKYGVENDSDRAVEVVVSAARPSDSGSSWTAIPALDWIEISPARIKVSPRGKGWTDVTISVPDDPAFAGKKYEFWLRASTDDEQIGVTLVTRVRFNTVNKPAEEKKP